MKKTTKFIAAVMFIFCHYFSYSQKAYIAPEHMSDFHKKIINRSAFIFEGKAIQQKQYHSRHGFSTCTTFQITKIFKGSNQIKLGSIKVVNSQGGTYEIIDKDGNKMEVTELDDPEGDKIYVGLTYIIFGFLGDSTSLGYADSPARLDKTDNELAIDKYDIIVIKNTKDISIEPVDWNGTKYKSLEEIYSFISSTVKEQEEKK